MNQKEFDEKFRELYTNMVEIAFEYVNRNKDEVDNIYIFASMEAGDFFYAVFYKMNGQLVKTHKINTVSNQQYDISRERVLSFYKLGVKYLEDTKQLFIDDSREVPTLLKIVYSPKTGKFNYDVSYDLHYSNDNKEGETDVFNEWFVEMGGKL